MILVVPQVAHGYILIYICILSHMQLRYYHISLYYFIKLDCMHIPWHCILKCILFLLSLAYRLVISSIVLRFLSMDGLRQLIINNSLAVIIQYIRHELDNLSLLSHWLSYIFSRYCVQFSILFIFCIYLLYLWILVGYGVISTMCLVLILHFCSLLIIVEFIITDICVMWSIYGLEAQNMLPTFRVLLISLLCIRHISMLYLEISYILYLFVLHFDIFLCQRTFTNTTRNWGYILCFICYCIFTAFFSLSIFAVCYLPFQAMGLACLLLGHSRCQHNIRNWVVTNQYQSLEFTSVLV